MTVLSVCMVLSVSLIQNASGPMGALTGSDDLSFTKNFEMIDSLGQAKESVGLDNMAATLKARWKDTDIVDYCKLMEELLARLQTDFDPVDYGKIVAFSEDVLSDLDKELSQGTNPVLVPHYFRFQEIYIGATNAVSHFCINKGKTVGEAWLNQRKDVMTRLLKVWELIQDARDPTWNTNIRILMTVAPLYGLIEGTSPESIKDPDLRAKYETDIKSNDEKRRWWEIQYRLHNTEDQLKKRLMNDIKAMYSTPPLAPDELKSLLDTYVKDEEQKKMFLEASQKQEQ